MNPHAVIEDGEKVQLRVKEPAWLVTRKIAVLPTRHKALFQDSLLETSGGGRKRRTWATILSLDLAVFPDGHSDSRSAAVHGCASQTAARDLSRSSASPTTGEPSGCSESREDERDCKWGATRIDQNPEERTRPSGTFSGTASPREVD